VIRLRAARPGKLHRGQNPSTDVHRADDGHRPEGSDQDGSPHPYNAATRSGRMPGPPRDEVIDFETPPGRPTEQGSRPRKSQPRAFRFDPRTTSARRGPPRFPGPPPSNARPARSSRSRGSPRRVGCRDGEKVRDLVHAIWSEGTLSRAGSVSPHGPKLMRSTMPSTALRSQVSEILFSCFL